MKNRIKIKSTIGEGYNMNPDDVKAIKQALDTLGYYKKPDYGITEYPDQQTIDSIKSFQKNNSLQVDGKISPSGSTLKSINKLVSDNKKTKTYRWITQKDGKVRSSHAERDGKIFSWDNPPEGGHPGEAPNCRCTAESVKKEEICKNLYVEIKNLEANADMFIATLERLNEELEALNEKLDAVTREIETSFTTIFGECASGAAIGFAISKSPAGAFGGCASSSLRGLQESPEKIRELEKIKKEIQAILNIRKMTEKDLEKTKENLLKALEKFGENHCDSNMFLD